MEISTLMEGMYGIMQGLGTLNPKLLNPKLLNPKALNPKPIGLDMMRITSGLSFIWYVPSAVLGSLGV